MEYKPGGVAYPVFLCDRVAVPGVMRLGRTGIDRGVNGLPFMPATDVQGALRSRVGG